MKIRDQTALSVQSDLDLHHPQKVLMSSSVRKELIGFTPFGFAQNMIHDFQNTELNSLWHCL